MNIWESKEDQRELQNQRENLIDVSMTTRRHQEIHLPLNHISTRKVIKVCVYVRIPAGLTD